MKIGYFDFERLFPYLIGKLVISRIRGTLFTRTLDMNFLDRYHKTVTLSGVNLVKTWCRFDIESTWVHIWCIHRYMRVTSVLFNRLFMVDMACPRWRIILDRCWADVGPVGPTSGHWRPCFLGYLGHFMTDLYGGIAYCFLWICALCTHISMFCFICSLAMILCVIKTVQPTPLVVSEPGRYNYYHIRSMNRLSLFWANRWFAWSKRE